MNLADQYEGNFLEALLLPQDKPVEVEIEKIEPAGSVKSADGRVIDKPVMHFKGKSRALVLAKCNARAIARKYGPNMDSWVGKTIGIFQARVNAFGQPDTPAIRVWGAPTDKRKGGRR